MSVFGDRLRSTLSLENLTRVRSSSAADNTEGAQQLGRVYFPAQ
jgi:hypothetical protein